MTESNLHPEVEAALQRLEERDPDIHAFVDEADRRGRLARDPVAAGPLTGMAVGVKDLYRADGLPTRAGSQLPAEEFEGEESLVVTRLRAAGASVLGKTAMDEFAYCEPPPTKNPRDRRRTPGGSSGGSAAAVAAGICDVAVGSQTLQSIIVPAAYCGVVGFRPTFGRLPFDGVPLAPSVDTVGFIASSIVDLERAVAAALPDWRAVPAPQEQLALGVPEQWGIRRLHAEGWAAFERHSTALAGAGVRLQEAVLPWNDDLASWATVVGDLLHGEMADVHGRWSERYEHLYRPRTLEAVARGRAITSERLEACRQAQVELRGAIESAADEAGVEAWICPAAGGVAPLGYESTGDSWMTSYWSVAGLPAVTVPVFDDPTGLPLGVQCVGRFGRDEELLQVASTLGSVLDVIR